MISTITLGLLICVNSLTLIEFKKINPDSLESIEASSEGYTSRSTKALYARMKNGDSINILFDKEARISPSVYYLSKNREWLWSANPFKSGDPKACNGLLCSLPNGSCKCSDRIVDSGFTFSKFSDSTAGGCILMNTQKTDYYKPQGKKKGRKIFATKYLSEKEMLFQFLNNPPMKISIQ